jgi:hypothetical protein
MPNLTEEAWQRQAKCGLPAEPLLDLRMTFASRSRVLILQFSLERLGAHVPQVFIRSENSNRYLNILDIVEPALEGIAPTKSDTVVRGARTPVAGPAGVLYFLLAEYRQSGGRMRSVARVDLSSNTAESWDPSKCVSESCTPVELLGADDDGVHAKAGFKIPAHTGSALDYEVEYHVVYLHWADRAPTRILPLPAVFF